MFDKNKKDEVEKTEEKKEVKKVSEKKESPVVSKAKSAFYFKGKHFKTGDVVDLPKEDLAFLKEKGKL